ncbi:MAG: 2-polyprenyl-3-methyl-6-methoxy-1,4-benzoquinone monooxygenase [Gammaproteobacteria bacterium]|jgi:ubiquinone biosynthesis monooxygenase Coq7
MLKRESPLERLIAGAAEGMRTCFAEASPHRPSPVATPVCADSQMDPEARRLSIRLMRVNHAGEVAAQALYNGQAVFAREEKTRRHLLAAAEEEYDHLAWCAQRIIELGGKPSRLTPLWYVGSFCIGAAAAAAGDRRSFGFIEETEAQVEAHLDDHLQRMPKADARSREILQEMTADEARHGAEARAQGAEPVPEIGRRLMHLGGSVLRHIAQVL